MTGVEHDLTETDNDTTNIKHETDNAEHDPADIKPKLSDSNLTDTDHDTNEADQNATVQSSVSNDCNFVRSDLETVGTIYKCSRVNTTDVDNNRNKKQGKTRNKKITQDKMRSARPVRMKTLSACLTLFGLFKNPSKLYQEPAMKQVYLTLLTLKDGEIQKLALACLMAYKLNYLMPYKENLDRLMEDKTFRDELMSFCSDEELNVVISEHRAEFIHILIRLVDNVPIT